MDRFKAHFSVVNRRDMEEDIGRHFNRPSHHGINDMSINILDFIYAPQEAEFSLDLRLQVEYNWVHALKSMAPHGLNMKDKPPLAKHSHDILASTALYSIKEIRS